MKITDIIDVTDKLDTRYLVGVDLEDGDVADVMILPKTRLAYVMQPYEGETDEDAIISFVKRHTCYRDGEIRAKDNNSLIH